MLQFSYDLQLCYHVEEVEVDRIVLRSRWITKGLFFSSDDKE